MKSSKEIRQQFIDFFQSKAHEFVPSASVVPFDDPTLLFTNAGMNQFKEIFLNQRKPSSNRAVNSQKCIRVSGKHNDLEEVGRDTYHHTFFEMLGNWSFGDYYKTEAISWAWELFTEIYKLEKSKLYASVFTDDDESAEIWAKVTDIPSERILRFGKKDNFWEMGEVGPCGPCSEIHYDRGADACDVAENHKCEVNGVCGRFVELWNLVFIQYNRKNDGSLEDLSSKHVDTGAGLERIVSVLNGVNSNYDTDLFMPILCKIEKLSGKKYAQDESGIPHRVIADHIRMLTVSIADGALPSNEGRGYVLRRVLRRAARFGRTLELTEPFLHKLVDSVSEILGEIFPEIVERAEHIKKTIRAEEESFGRTLDRGLQLFDEVVANLNKSEKTEISGDEAFKLYDTFGFPMDLTRQMADEIGFTIDETGFEIALETQRNRAREAGKFSAQELEKSDWIVLNKGEHSEFLGYDFAETKTKINSYRKVGEQFEIVLEKTPFYAESGGQIGDLGTIKSNNFAFSVVDTQEIGGKIVHFCRLESGEISDAECVAKIDNLRRDKIRANHTATHLLQSALQKHLGEHVHQKGSLVTDEYLRFDLTHFERIDREILEKIEAEVNSEIRNNFLVETTIRPIEDAKKAGAMALFGEKYADDVRVVEIGKTSIELCGGTHCERTGNIGNFVIVSESAIGAGVRRIEAITGEIAESYLRNKRKIAEIAQSTLQCNMEETIVTLQKQLNENKILKKEIAKLKSGAFSSQVSAIISNADDWNDGKLVVQKVEADSIDSLKKMCDQIREKLQRGIVVLGCIIADKPIVACAVSDDLMKENWKAGNIVRALGQKLGGGGGGKPHLATAGGKDAEKLDEVLASVEEILEKLK